MPTYEYACDACGHQFDQYQTITAEPLKVCPECGKRKLNRLLGAGGGIIFKGGGFYQTDYRSESYKKAAEAEKSGGKGESAAKSDSKPAGGKEPVKPAAKPEKPAAQPKSKPSPD
jgi:putative FmdB family regulatory protein